MIRDIFIFQRKFNFWVRFFFPKNFIGLRVLKIKIKRTSVRYFIKHGKKLFSFHLNAKLFKETNEK